MIEVIEVIEVIETLVCGLTTFAIFFFRCFCVKGMQQKSRRVLWRVIATGNVENHYGLVLDLSGTQAQTWLPPRGGIIDTIPATKVPG